MIIYKGIFEIEIEIENEKETDIASPKVYSTPNVALAAYLYSQGFEYIGADHFDPANVAFQFTNSSKAMAVAISDFQMGKAESARFYMAYKGLLREVRS